MAEQVAYTRMTLGVGKPREPRELLGEDLLGEFAVPASHYGQCSDGDAQAGRTCFKSLGAHQDDVLVIATLEDDVGVIQRGW
ncbi:hypothetical protein OHA25_56770 [Nonomuraea sp. NBC_00507]|uniref:hypothetical protein n=1 Tax=Nonomuraea sp. NBC_00507 TaxID=2976002 RepID=UPI002E17F77A